MGSVIAKFRCPEKDVGKAKSIERLPFPENQKAWRGVTLWIFLAFPVSKLRRSDQPTGQLDQDIATKPTPRASTPLLPLLEPPPRQPTTHLPTYRHHLPPSKSSPHQTPIRELTLLSAYAGVIVLYTILGFGVIYMTASFVYEALAVEGADSLV